jgi:hypothetical protein
VAADRAPAGPKETIVADGFAGRARSALEHRSVPLFAALLAFVLMLPALRAGLVADDYFHRLILLHLGEWGAAAHPVWDLFSFAPARLVPGMMDAGTLPWWTDPGINISLARPLTALTHILDYALWPDTPALQHLHSLLWFALGVFLVGSLYRRVQVSAAAAGMAALLFAVEDAHSMVGGWLANRNAALCLVFGAGMMLMHISWRRTRAPNRLIFALILFTVGLGCGEATLGAAAYVVAWQLLREEGSWLERFRPLAPYALVVILWRLAYSMFGYGVRGSSLYLDPVQQPLSFLGALAERLPLLVAAQWLQAPVDLWLALPRLVQIAASIAASLLTVAVCLLLWKLLRQDAQARFWALGMVLSLVPLCAAFPMDRLLLFAGIGAFGLMAALFESSGVWPWQRIGPGGWGRRAAVLLLFLHMPVAAFLLTARTSALPLWGTFFEAGARAAPRGPDVAQQTFVFVNGNEFFVTYTHVIRTATGEAPAPRRMAQLSSVFTASEVRRADPQTLVVTTARGFFADTLDRLLVSPGQRFDIGRRFELPDFVAEIRALTSDGRPLEVAYRFNVPLENPGLRFLYWKNGRLQEFPLPAVGERVTLSGWVWGQIHDG